MKTVKKTISLATAVLLAAGIGFVPTGFVHAGAETAAVSDNCNYAEGRVIVGYIDTDDMDMSAGQEKKSERLLGDSQELMICDDVDIDDVDVDESDMSNQVTKRETVDKTLALVESDTKSTEELMEEISGLPNVDYVEPDYVFTVEEGETDSAAAESSEATTAEESVEATSASGDYTGRQWAFTGSDYGINVPDWNNSEKTNAEGTVVAVIDTGVDYNHEDLQGVMWDEGNNYKALTNLGGGRYGIDVAGETSGGKTDSDPYPNSDHGTHCAGIIAARWNGSGVSGVAGGAEIMAVKASYDGESFNLSDIIEAYNYVIAAKEAGVNVVAINASLGGTVSGLSTDVRSIVDLVNEAGRDCNIVSTFASGNDGANCDTITKSSRYYLPYFLTESPYKLVVNAIDKNGNMANYSVGATNYGMATTDVFAPGKTILSTMRTGYGSDTFNKNYGYMNGTSMATPAVTGAVAVLAAKYPNASAEQIVDHIKNNVTAVAAFADKCTSGGRLNVGKMLNEDMGPITLKADWFSLGQTSLEWNGEAAKPAVSCSRLTEGTDYNVTYEPAESTGDETCTEPGKYKAVITGIGDAYGGYTGSVELEYAITKVRTSMTLSSTSFIYDGESRKVSAVVTASGGRTMTEGTDYDISGETAGKLPGTYKVYATMKGETASHYSDSSAKFVIAVQTAKVTKLKRARRAFTVKVSKIAKSRASGYQVRYSLYKSMSGAKTKTIGTKYTKTSRKISGLKRLKRYYVQVRTYKTAGGKKYYSSWKGTYSVKTK